MEGDTEVPLLQRENKRNSVLPTNKSRGSTRATSSKESMNEDPFISSNGNIGPGTEKPVEGSIFQIEQAHGSQD